MLMSFWHDDDIRKTTAWEDWAYQVEIATISLEGLCDSGLGLAQAVERVKEHLAVGAFTMRSVQTVTSLLTIASSEIEQRNDSRVD